MTQNKTTDEEMVSWNQLTIGEYFCNQHGVLFQKDSETKLRIPFCPPKRSLYWVVDETIKDDKKFIRYYPNDHEN